MGHTNARRMAWAALLLSSAIALGTAGCSANEDTRSDAASGQDKGAAAEQPVAPEQLTQEADQPGQATAQAEAPAEAPADVPTTQRSIIYTGSITIRVPNVNEAATKAMAIATGAGGVIGSDERTIDERRSQATLSLRIPAQRFTEVLNALPGALGEEERRDITAEDVTDQVVDLDARIEIAQASVDRIRALLARAETISEIVSLESELSRREANLNSLLQRKNKLADLTALSTITVVLLGPDAAVEEDDDETIGFIAGLKAGWQAFVASVVILLTIIGALLPWLLVIGVPAYLLIRVVRRIRRKGPPSSPVPPM
ncbi:MAG: DUF4349 domain-containing protein [Micromonosporaceae bacterium]|nr:DUF4349 domain-containing protein [Micromonosporaceae bacterium]